MKKESRTKVTFDRDVLKKLVRESGMTYKQIANDIGCSPVTINMILGQTYHPGLDLLVSLADYFAVPTDLLIGRLTQEQCDAVLTNYRETFHQLRHNAYEESIYARSPSGKQSPPKDYEAPWPYNLMEDLFGYGFSTVLSDDQLAGFELAMSKMSPRTAQVFLSVYRDGKTLEEAGKEVGVGRERARQIVRKAVRILNSPVCKSLIADGAEGSSKIKEELFYISKARRELTSARTELDKLQRLSGDEKALEYARRYVLNFEDVIAPSNGMTVRLSNCLRRSRLNTVDDILKAFENGSIYKVRNFGRRCAEELRKYLEDAGYSVPKPENGEYESFSEKYKQATVGA